MRYYITKTVRRILPIIILFATIQVLQSCSKDDESAIRVDLRYRVKDAYAVEAEKPALITIQVKSTHSWEVYGKEDWYTISPAKGEAGETYDITIQCDENTTPNERVGKIYIKSDYWIGKEFTIDQRGNTTNSTLGVDNISEQSKFGIN